MERVGKLEVRNRVGEGASASSERSLESRFLLGGNIDSGRAEARILGRCVWSDMADLKQM